MKISDLDEMRVSSARAIRFFDMLYRKRKAKEEKQRELRGVQEFQEEIERKRRLQPKESTPSPAPSQPVSSETQKPQPPALPVDPATQDFWRWCRNKEEKEEPPPWKIRNPRLYRGAK
jgi:hypothetical protein